MATDEHGCFPTHDSSGDLLVAHRVTTFPLVNPVEAPMDAVLILPREAISSQPTSAPRHGADHPIHENVQASNLMNIIPLHTPSASVSPHHQRHSDQSHIRSSHHPKLQHPKLQHPSFLETTEEGTDFLAMLDRIMPMRGLKHSHANDGMTSKYQRAFEDLAYL